MIIRCGIQNHYSVRDYQALSFVASRLKDSESGLLAPANAADGGASSEALRLLPAIAIYGANAAGKSSLIHGLQFLSRFVATSHTRVTSGEGTPYTPFALDEKSREEPSKYDIDFVIDHQRYHFGFSIDGRVVLEEYLYSFPLFARQTRTILYHRNSSEKEQFYFGKNLKGENRQISRLVRPNSLFISAAAQNAHPQLTPIYQFFADKILRQDSSSDTELSKQFDAYFGADSLRFKSAMSFIESADFGICGVDVKKVQVDEEQIRITSELVKVLIAHAPNGSELPPYEPEREVAEVQFRHMGERGKAYPIKLADESAGTTALIRLLGPMFSRLSEGGLLVVDELDRSLHPIICRELIKLFSSPATNPGRGQILFSTHDTNLLSSELLRRDQIYFAEKDHEGSTAIYSLADMKVRAAENISVGYLEGRYGAIPMVDPHWITNEIARGEDA